MKLYDTIKRANCDIYQINIDKMSREQLTELFNKTISDISVLINEYLYQKRRKIKRTEGMKNSLLKVTALYKEKFHNIIKSKDIAHLDTIIEEYLSLDDINNDLLFSESNLSSKKYPVNYTSIFSLAFN